MDEKEINIIIARQIAHYMEKENISQKEIAEYVGVSQASVSNWCKGIKMPRMDKIDKLCELFGCTRSDLMDERIPYRGHASKLAQVAPSKGVRIPVFGTVRAGIPLDAITDILDYEEIPQEMARQGEYFGLRVKGDSMLPDIREDDIVIVRQQPDVENGDTAIVLINGDEATVKRVTKSSAGLTLIPANSQYAPMVYSMLDVATLPVKILGKVVEIRRRL